MSISDRVGLHKTIIKKANEVANIAKLGYNILELKQCNSSFYRDLYKVLSGSDVLFHWQSSEERRCQLILKALESFLSPLVKLDHIRYSNLALRDEFDVKNLLDIFAVLFKANHPPAEQVG